VPVEKLAEPPVDVRPPNCIKCGTKLRGSDPEPFRHQVTDLPPAIEPHVTEHRLHALECACCGTVTRAELPPDVPRSNFGPRLVSMVAMLLGVYRLSHRMVVDAASDLFGIDMSLGSVTACQRQASVALAKPVEEAREHVKQQPVKQADETSWFEGPKRGKVWMWVVHTPLVSVFLIHASRGSGAALEILGEAFGYLVSDRWSGYNWWPLKNRQVCWAHLSRQFQGFVDLGGAPAEIGQALLEQKERLFDLWHRVRDGTIQRSSFLTYLTPIRQEVEALLEKGSRCRNKKTAGRCAAILKVFPALWTFARVEGVEPTNNGSERSIRPGVILRKLSYGTHSAEGSRFVERMLTVNLTLRQQGRDVLRYVTEAVVARQTGTAPASLLPAVP
jgi:transposase